MSRRACGADNCRTAPRAVGGPTSKRQPHESERSHPEERSPHHPGRHPMNVQRFAERATLRNANRNPHHRPRARLPPVQRARTARADRGADDRRGLRARPSGHDGARATSTRWPGSGASTSATARGEIADAMRAQALRLPYYHSFSSMATDTPALLAERLIAMAPGADVEGLLRQQRLGRERHAGEARAGSTTTLLGRPAKKKIISRERGYHGVTIASASLTGLDEPARAASTCRCR